MANSNKVTIVPFNMFNANKVYPIRILDETQNISISSFSASFYGVSDNIYEYEKIVRGNIISSVYNNINDYIKNEYNRPDVDQQEVQMVKLSNDFLYLIVPQNMLENGNYYAVTVSLHGALSAVYNSDEYIFGCFSDPIIWLDGYEYQKNELQIDITNPLIIKKSVCTLHYGYIQEENDAIKYYQFFLYDVDGNLLGTSKKIYSINISYTVENFNNKEEYVLKLCCETQSGNVQWVDINLIIDYDQENIYTDIQFDFNNQTAINNISINITQLNGTGGGYTFKPDSTDGEVIIADNGQITFIDAYKVIKDNFLCRIWCSNLTPNTSIFTMRVMNTEDYIDIYFTGTRFYAIKYSNGLKTSYISNELISESGLENVQIYLAIGCYKGRIEMHTSIIS